MQERLAIAGSGTIACRACRRRRRPRRSAAVGALRPPPRTARGRAVAKHCDKLARAQRLRRAGTVVDRSGRAGRGDRSWSRRWSRTPITRGRCWPSWPPYTGPDEILATTTSSLSIADLRSASGHPDRFVGLHVFNPVPRMELVELAFGPADPRGRARAGAGPVPGLGKTAGRGPRHRPGSSSTGCCSPTCSAPSSCWSQTGMEPAEVDRCMTLGRGDADGPDRAAGLRRPRRVRRRSARRSARRSRPRLDRAGRRAERSAARPAAVSTTTTNGLLRLRSGPTAHHSRRDVPHSSTSSPEARDRPVPSGPVSF